MKIIFDLKTLQHELRNRGKVALVPTMGNLHDGHLSLVKQGKECADTVVCTIFVNQSQFDEEADFVSYPRTLEDDLKKLERSKTDIAFVPSAELMYPNEQNFFIEVPGYISQYLEGEFRGPFFSMVATIVMKFFFLIKPDIALFGKKDYQQAFMIKKLCAQFSTGIVIVLGETIRDFDGLALSSRNAHLNSSVRPEANLMYEILIDIRHKILQSKESERFDLNFLNQLERNGESRLNSRGWQCDYVSIINKEVLLQPNYPKKEWKELIILAAARLSNVRLIDNIEIINSNNSL